MQVLFIGISRVSGSMMILAWVSLSSIAIITSRHHKTILPKTQVLGKPIWFQVENHALLQVKNLILAFDQYSLRGLIVK